MTKLHILLGHKEYASEVLNVFQNKNVALEQQENINNDFTNDFIRTEIIEVEVNDIRHNTVHIVLGLDQATGFILQVDTSEKEIRKNLHRFEKEYLALYIVTKEVI